DGAGTFTGTDQPYFLYNEILMTAQVSSARTWEWAVPSTVGTFAFQVLVDAPAEMSVIGGTFLDRDGGIVGTSFLFDPLLPGGTVPFLAIRGPTGWNANNALTCHV